MKIEAAEMGERVATEELVRELVRNDARRGEFMIMSDDEDEERFVQIACDYDEVGGKSDGLFDLEKRPCNLHGHFPPPAPPPARKMVKYRWKLRKDVAA